MNLSIRTANPEDASLLSKLGSDLFRQTFQHLYDVSDLQTFLKSAHNEKKVRGDMDLGAHYGIAFSDRTAIGYVKFGPNALPVSIGSGRQLEIKQLYLDSAYHRQQIGRKLMDFAFAQLAPLPVDALFVGVWTKNVLAQKFYARLGFKGFACYWFPVGRTLDRELIMVKLGATQESFHCFEKMLSLKRL